MIQAKHVSNAKMFYNHYSNSTVIKIEIDDSVNVTTEITIAEAKQLRDELSDLIEWIAGEEYV